MIYCTNFCYCRFLKGIYPKRASGFLGYHNIILLYYLDNTWAPRLGGGSETREIRAGARSATGERLGRGGAGAAAATGGGRLWASETRKRGLLCKAPRGGWAMLNGAGRRAAPIGVCALLNGAGTGGSLSGAGTTGCGAAGLGCTASPWNWKKDFRNSNNMHRYSLEKRSFYAELQNIFGIDEIYN